MRNGSLLVCFFILFGSVSSGWAAPSPDTVAGKYCACAKPAMDSVESAMKEMRAGNAQMAMKIAQEMQQQSSSLEKCFNKLKEEYSDYVDDEEFSNKVDLAIKKRCPAPKFEGMAPGAAMMPG